LRNVVADYSGPASAQYVIVAEDILIGSVCYEGAQSAAATERIAAVINISARNAEMLISNAMISATVCQPGCQH
jgi:hypothetical protein